MGGIAGVLILVLVPIGVNAQNGTKEKFIALSEYLADGSGRWVTQNPEYDSTKKWSAKSFEMHYQWDKERQVLWTDVIIHFTTLNYTSQKGLHRLNPSSQRIEYISFCYEGAKIEGTLSFQSDSVFTTTFRSFNSEGVQTDMKDWYKILTNDSQHNIPYEWKNEKWESLGNYTWTKIK